MMLYNLQSHALKSLRCTVDGEQHGHKPGTRVNFLGEVREGPRFIQAIYGDERA